MSKFPLHLDNHDDVMLLLRIAAVLAGAVLLVWFASEMQEREIEPFDAYVRLTIHRYSSPNLTAFMRWVTTLGSTVWLSAASAVTTVALWRRGQRHTAVEVIVTMGGAGILVLAMKEILQRPRPEAFFDEALPGSFSFPSGHAFSSLCFYYLMAKLIENRFGSIGRWIVLLSTAALVLTIGVSRVYLGVHYVSDVVAGYLAGVTWLMAIHILKDRDKLRALLTSALNFRRHR